jgi:hypothetical protein
MPVSSHSSARWPRHWRRYQVVAAAAVLGGCQAGQPGPGPRAPASGRYFHRPPATEPGAVHRCGQGTGSTGLFDMATRKPDSRQRGPSQ